MSLLLRPVLLLLLLPLAALADVTPQRVRFDSLDRHEGAALALDGVLFAPDGAAPPGGRPAVIALHGCGGIFSAAEGRGDAPSARHAAYAQLLVRQGYVVLFPDSFNPRGTRQVCTVRMGERTINAQQRRLDVLGALAWLRRQPGVDAKRIALLGWSHGGSTVLASVNGGDARVAQFAQEAGAPFFRTAVAFYPGCTASLRAERWQPLVPLAVLIGAADDWTPAAACESLATRARAQKWPLDLVVYPDAHHGFDAPGGRVVLRKDVPNGVRPGDGVHVGPEPKAREASRERLLAILKEAFAS